MTSMTTDATADTAVHTDRRRLGAAAGLLAGPLFLTVVALLTWAELGTMHRLGWGYTRKNDVPWPSGLALGHYGAVQVVNFAVAGLLLVVCARGLRGEVRGISGRIGTGVLTLLGLALVCSAFPTDHAAARGKNPDTWHGWMHTGAFVGVALSALLAPAILALALRRDPRWRPLALVSACVPPLLVAFFFAQKALHDVAFTLFLVAVFGWVALLSARLRKLAR